MYIGVYLCFAGFFYFSSLLWLVRKGHRPGVYSAWAWGLILLALGAFLALSIWAELIPFRGASSWSYPGDYLASGPVGWLIMLFLPAGILAPVWLAGRISRKKARWG